MLGRLHNYLPIELQGCVESENSSPKILRLEMENRGGKSVGGVVEVASCPRGFSVKLKRVAVKSIEPDRNQVVEFSLQGPAFNPYNRYRFDIRFHCDGEEATGTVVFPGSMVEGVNLGEFRESTDIEASSFGIGTHFGQNYEYQRAIPLLHAMGAKMVRDRLQVEVKDGRAVLSDYCKEYLAALKEADIALCAYQYGPLEADAYAEMMRAVVPVVSDQVKV